MKSGHLRGRGAWQADTSALGKGNCVMFFQGLQSLTILASEALADRVSRSSEVSPSPGKERTGPASHHSETSPALRPVLYYFALN